MSTTQGGGSASGSAALGAGGGAKHLTQTGSAMPPVFSGERADWADFRLVFRVWLRCKGIDISESALAALTDTDPANALLGDWIFLALQKRERRQVSDKLPNGKAMWASLRERYEKMSMTERIITREQLAEVSITHAGDMEEYIASKKELISQLRDGGESWDEEDIVVELLKGLGTAYDAVRQAMELLPPQNRTTEVCEHHLRIRSDIIRHSEKVEANATSHQRSSGTGRGTRSTFAAGTRRHRRCTVCGGKDHDRTTCPQVTCFRCGGKGHVQASCDKPTAHANATSVRASETRGAMATLPSMRADSKRLEAQKTSDRAEQHYEEHVALAGDQAPLTADALRVLQDHGGWLVDSGTTAHMTPNREELHNYVRAKGTVSVASDHQLNIIGRGVVRMCVELRDGGTTDIEFMALHVEGLVHNLFATDWVVQQGGNTVLAKQPYITWPSGEHVRCERWRPRTLLLPAMEAHMTLQQLHERLTHTNDADCRVVAKQLGIKVTGQRKEPCNPCALNKAKRQPIPKEADNRAQDLLGRVCVDAAGPFPRSIQGHRHVLLYTDEATGCCWPFFTRTKSQFEHTVNRFVSEVGKPHVLRTDNAPELIGGKFRDEWHKLGVRDEGTARNAPQQNGKCERMLATLTADCRTLLNETGMPNSLWPYALATAATSRNIVRLAKLEGEVREQARQLCRVPPHNLWRAWGCAAVLHDPTAKAHGKLVPRGIKAIFLGYRPGTKAWLFLNPRTKKVVISRDAVFLEAQSGASLLDDANDQPQSRSGIWDTLWFQSATPVLPAVPATLAKPVTPPTPATPTTPATPANPVTPPTPATPLTPPTPATPATPVTPRTPATPLTPSTPETPESDVGGSRVPLHYEDQSDEDDGDAGIDFGWFQFDEELLSTPVTEGSAAKPIMIGDSEQELDESSKYAETPTSYKDAMASDEAALWEHAIGEEIKNHIDYRTWKLVPSEQVTGKLLTTGWTFAVKLDQTGHHLRYKARLYVKGCQQTTSQYHETSAPVTNLITLRMLLHHAVTHRANVVHIDVKAAYLNAPLTEDLYMCVPDGVSAQPGQVCKILKSIYGLKQAGANWHGLITKWFASVGFTRSETDPCLYVKKGSGAMCTLYVDDMILVSRSTHEQRVVVESLRKKFTIKVTSLNVYLAQRIVFEEDTVTIDMSTYVKDMLRKYGLHHANKTAVPCGKQVQTVEEEAVGTDAKGYRSLVGQLQWVCQTTRPDLTFAVHSVSRAVARPLNRDAAAAKRIMRYLTGTSATAILVRSGGELVAYVDADWATDQETRRSVSGYVIGYEHGDGTLSPIVWRTRKQSCVATSTCEAEYVGCHDVCREVCYLRRLLTDMGEKCEAPTPIYCDNKAAVLIGNNDVKRTKHARYIDIRYHFARHCQAEGRVRFTEVRSSQNIADMFTKPLSRDRFMKLARRITVETTS